MLFAGLLLASALASGSPPKAWIELNDDELLHRVPELAGVRAGRDETLVRMVLQPALEAVNDSFDKFADLSAAEQISEVRLDKDGAFVRSRHERFRYVATLPQNSLDVHELRLSEADSKGAKAGGDGFVAGDRFVALTELLLPEFDDQRRVRAVGRIGNTVVFVFALNTGAALSQTPALQALVGPNRADGLVWVDAQRLRPVRFLCEMTLDQAGAAARMQRADITFADVHFDALGATLLLPAQVAYGASQGDVQVHAVHRFSDFHLYGRNDANDAAQAKKNSGAFAAGAVEPDAWERLAEGAAALEANDNPAAVKALREAVRLDATLAPAHYQLARALRATGDIRGAEVEARAALSGMSEGYAVHNLLGILLVERGAAVEALPELRETVRLAPGEALAHGNLARALDATGDHGGALAEMRRALELAPGNKTLQAQMDRIAKAVPEKPAPAPGGEEAVIRVDVRQVLVPVVVLNREGHSVSDLKPADFRVLEDGVEQTITSFRVETSGEPGIETAAPTAAPPAGAVAPVAPKPATAARPRNTYLIVIDAMDSAVSSLHDVRQALQKFFASEPPGDSQFGLFVVGQPSRVLVNMTRDPAVILAALDDKAFFKMIASSIQSSAESDMRAFVNTLDEARAAIDQHSKDAGMLKTAACNQVRSLEAVERNRTVNMLGALRDLVRELSKGHEHRTLILISDGFQLTPGLDPLRLADAYLGGCPLQSENSLTRVQPEFDAVVKVAARANVIINTIDSRGVYTPSWTDASSSASGSATNPAVTSNVMSTMNEAQAEHGLTLTEFAAATGGTSYQNSNDLFAGIHKAVAEGRDYYTLGYVSTNAAMDGKFRTITVEVKGHKVTLRAKRGYWATEN